MVRATPIRPSIQLEKEIERMTKKVQEAFGYPLSKIQATKVIAWKSRNYDLQLSEKELLKILGDKG